MLLAKSLDFERGFLVKNLAIVCLLMSLCLLVCLISNGGWDLVKRPNIGWTTRITYVIRHRVTDKQMFLEMIPVLKICESFYFIFIFFVRARSSASSREYRPNLPLY